MQRSKPHRAPPRACSSPPRCVLGLPALLSAALLPAAAASAQAPPLHIAWQAPAACPDEAAVTDRVQTVLGEELSAYGADWQIHARVSGGGNAWELSLGLREPGSAPPAMPRERVLHAAQCADLVEAAAVAIAIALGDARGENADPAAVAPSPPASPASGTSTEASPSRAAPAPADDGKGPEPVRGSARRSLDPSVEALIDSGSLGSPAFGASLAVGAWFEALGIDVHGSWLPEREKVIGPGENADFGLLAMGGRACYRWGNAGGFAVAPCAGFEFGRFSAESHGLVAGTNVRDTWLAPSVGVDLRLALLGPLAARSRLELLFPVRRQTYRVDLVQPVHEIPTLTLRWSVGFGGALSLR